MNLDLCGHVVICLSYGLCVSIRVETLLLCQYDSTEQVLNAANIIGDI